MTKQAKTQLSNIGKTQAQRAIAVLMTTHKMNHN